ncbi:MAG: 50S ribosomal protein L28 [Cytophagales bacterium]|nr:50S ribosomal protein L28 [Cytophagales bacterium]
MSRKCFITGKSVMFGNNVSHANNKTRRRFDVNIHKQRFFVPELGRWVKMKVAASTMRTINKKGIFDVLK